MNVNNAQGNVRKRKVYTLRNNAYYFPKLKQIEFSCVRTSGWNNVALG